MPSHSKYLAFFLCAAVLVPACAPPVLNTDTSRTISNPPATSTIAAPEPISSTIVETNPPAAATPSLEPAPKPPTLLERLDKRAVTDEHFARRDLYSWTTPDQILGLRQTKTLLIATAKTRGAPSPYSRLLMKLAEGPQPGRDIAKLLSEHPGLTKRRYAWPSPFATAVPLGERSYGHTLIHVVLKDESLLIKLDPLEHEPFVVMDQNNKLVVLADAARHPERIGAVFHVRRKPDGGPRFREYIICNESMIARWSVGTPHEKAVVAEDSALIAELLQSPLVSALGKDAALDAASMWSHATDEPTLLDAWRSAIAFDSPKYKPSVKTLGAIATSLTAYDASGDPLDHVPSAIFLDKP